MTDARASLVAFLSAQKGEKKLCRQFGLDAGSLFFAAETGSISLAEANRCNAENVAKSISRATREAVTDLLTVSNRDEKVNPIYRSGSRYDSFLSLALHGRRKRQFDNEHGADYLEGLTTSVWELLCRGYVATIQRACEEFLDDFDAPMASNIAFGGAMLVTYAAAYASVGDADAYDEVRGLLRLLSALLPIGSPVGSGGLWLVLTS